MHNIKKFYFLKITQIILITSLIIGCTTQQQLSNYPPPAKKKSNTKNATSPIEINTFQASGILGIRTADDTTSIYWNWQQYDKKNYKIILRGTLGIGTIIIIGKPNRVTLKKSNGEEFTTKNPEQLLYNQTRWRLPISNIYYWIQSAATPNFTAIKTYNVNNQLSILKQNHWVIKYEKYQKIKNINLPTKIKLTKKDLSLKIIIKKWNI